MGDKRSLRGQRRTDSAAVLAMVKGSIDLLGCESCHRTALLPPRVVCCRLNIVSIAVTLTIAAIIEPRHLVVLVFSPGYFAKETTPTPIHIASHFEADIIYIRLNPPSRDFHDR